MNIGGVDHTRMLFRAECAVVPALVSRGAAALTLVSGGCTAALTLVSGQTVPRKGSFFQSEGAEISCAERAPPRKGSFFQSGGLRFLVLRGTSPRKGSFFQSGGLNFLVPHGTAPRKGRFSRTVGGTKKMSSKSSLNSSISPSFCAFSALVSRSNS